MSEGVSWKLEKFRNSSQKYDILALRKIVFPNEDYDKEQVEFWDWEFDDNYAGKAKIFLATDNKKLVGHYAVCPSCILVDGEEKKGSIVVDVMTHPEYRYQGMFTEIGRYALKCSGEDGIEFSYGFPIRKGVMPGHLKVGWKVAFDLPVYVYPVNYTAIIRKFTKNAIISGIVGLLPDCCIKAVSRVRDCFDKSIIKEADKFIFTPELDDLLKDINRQHKVMQRRDRQFLDWRYNANPLRNYKVFYAFSHNGRLDGYAVARKAQIYDLRCVTIMDIQSRHFSNKITASLLNVIRRYAVKEGCSLVGCMINNNYYKKSMLKAGYIRSPYVFKFIIHENSHISYMSELMDNTNWLLTWADTDDL